jgi:hypothetical protein
MLFQRRHYVEIAAIIAAIPDRSQRAITALHFSEQLAGTNPQFDGVRFLRAAMGLSPAESVDP